MAKKHIKRHNSLKASKSLTKHIPPSVPKCVKPCPEHGGYITDYIDVHGVSAQFLFKKVSIGYDIYMRRSSTPNWTCIKSDISFSPTTRNLFKTQPTLSKAIAAVENWIDTDLPNIR